MSYYIYELVNGSDYPVLNKKQRQLAWITARSHLRRAGTELPSIVCSYGAESSEDDVEAVVLAETGLKTAWVRHTLEEFAFDKSMAMMMIREPPAPQDLPMPDVALTKVEDERRQSPEEELSAWGREQFAAQLAAKQRGRPRLSLTCDACNREFPNYNAKYNHTRRGKCVAVAST